MEAGTGSLGTSRCVGGFGFGGGCGCGCSGHVLRTRHELTTRHPCYSLSVQFDTSATSGWEPAKHVCIMTGSLGGALWLLDPAGCVGNVQAWQSHVARDTWHVAHGALWGLRGHPELPTVFPPHRPPPKVPLQILTSSIQTPDIAPSPRPFPPKVLRSGCRPQLQAPRGRPHPGPQVPGGGLAAGGGGGEGWGGREGEEERVQCEPQVPGGGKGGWGDRG